jgi:hypothetical protein
MAYTLTPEGTYKGRPTLTELGESGTGTPYVRVSFDVGNGKTAFVYFYLSEKAKRYAERDLEALGFNWDEQAPAVAGDEVLLNCKHEEYNGKTKERWQLSTKKAVKPLSKGGIFGDRKPVAVDTYGKTDAWAAWKAAGSDKDVARWKELVLARAKQENVQPDAISAAGWRAIGSAAKKLDPDLPDDGIPF